jgi:hypothetical protein
VKVSSHEIDILFERYGIAPVTPGGTDSAGASHGGREARLCLRDGAAGATLEFSVGGAAIETRAPHTDAEAVAIVQSLQTEKAVPRDASFEHMVAHLLVKATKLFEECGGTTFELSPVRLHPTSYHIENVQLVVARPLHVAPRLDPDSHDRRAVFDHRHGDSIVNPK